MQVPWVSCAGSAVVRCRPMSWGVPVSPPRTVPHCPADQCFPVFGKGSALSRVSKIPLSVWGLSGTKVGVVLLVISVWGVMNVREPDTAGSYCLP